MRDKGARTSSIGPNVGGYSAYDVARKDKDLKKKIGTKPKRLCWWFERAALATPLPSQ